MIITKVIILLQSNYCCNILISKTYFKTGNFKNICIKYLMYFENYLYLFAKKEYR